MRSLDELIDRNDSAWPLVQQWVGEASISVDILPAEMAAGEAAVYAAQVTTRSPMGAVVLHAAGILIDHGWLRVLGAGGHPHFERSLPGWNEGRSRGFYLVADDVLGGAFALNGGALGKDLGNLYYFSPDQLQWEPCNFGYSRFLEWAMSDHLAGFYTSLRWNDWTAEVKGLTADQAINVFPPLFAKGLPNEERSHRPVPVSDQYAFQLDMQRQLNGSQIAETLT
jgi:hypothetical protein